MTSSPQHKIAILASGSGTLLEHMVMDKLPISLAVVDRPCPAWQIADAARIPIALQLRGKYGWPDTVDHRDIAAFDRLAFSLAIAESLNNHGITVAAMAGFMTILAPEFFGKYKGVTLNIHPSLLPAFKGEHAVQDALDAGVKITGTTIHIATDELDDGPIIAQRAVGVKSSDTVDSLWGRIKRTERPLYSNVLHGIMNGNVTLPPLI